MAGVPGSGFLAPEKGITSPSERSGHEESITKPLNLRIDPNRAVAGQSTPEDCDKLQVD